MCNKLSDVLTTEILSRVQIFFATDSTFKGNIPRTFCHIFYLCVWQHWWCTFCIALIPLWFNIHYTEKRSIMLSHPLSTYRCPLFRLILKYNFTFPVKCWCINNQIHSSFTHCCAITLLSHDSVVLVFFLQM